MIVPLEDSVFFVQSTPLWYILFKINKLEAVNHKKFC